MTLGPNLTEKLARARGDLRLGLPVVLVGSGRAMAAVAVETLTAERLADLAALGPLDLALTARRAETLKARASRSRSRSRLHSIPINSSGSRPSQGNVPLRGC